MKRILILYAEVMGYTKACFDQLVIDFNVEILVIQLDHLKLTPYKPEFDNKFITFFNKSQLINQKLFFETCINFDPDVIFVSGWMDKEYLKVARYFNRNGYKVVSFVDNQWENTLKQIFASLFGRWFLHLHFTDLWVGGARQFEFGKRMGFKNRNIKFGFYSADFNLFNKIFLEKIKLIEKISFPKELIFVGRLNEVKGLALFLEIFVEFHNLWPNWKFKIIGSGSQINLVKDYLKRFPQWIYHLEYMDPIKLQEEIVNSGIFCLPSISEPWGVVIHEFALAGFPILCSDACGASDVFVKDGYNGFVFKSKDKLSLKITLYNFLNLSDSNLKKMSKRSHEIGCYITPEIWAATAYSF